jgi:hypothetical protein
MNNIQHNEYKGQRRGTAKGREWRGLWVKGDKIAEATLNCSPLHKWLRLSYCSSNSACSGVKCLNMKLALFDCIEEFNLSPVL